MAQSRIVIAPSPKLITQERLFDKLTEFHLMSFFWPFSKMYGTPSSFKLAPSDQLLHNLGATMVREATNGLVLYQVPGIWVREVTIAVDPCNNAFMYSFEVISERGAKLLRQSYIEKVEGPDALIYLQ